LGILADLEMYFRFAWGLRGFLRQTITLEEAKAIVQQRLAERESNFLRLVERGIFGYPRSPYLPLLRLAQVELGDIQSMVRHKGLEDTLRALRRAGVYVTFEEFKGREPIVRGGRIIPVQAHDFDNPYLENCYHAESGGTTGARTRVMVDLDHLAAQAPLLMLAYDVHGVLGVPTAMWRGVLPDGSGISNTLRHARFGQPPPRWFSPMVSRELKPSLKHRLATQCILGMGRLSGVPMSGPEPVGLDQAAVVARWAAWALEVHGACLIRAHISTALRVCLAAHEEGLDLTGATCMGAGEPPTPAKVRGITRTGARYVPNYVFSEAGHVGTGCVRPADGNDIHLFKDALALVQGSRQVPGSDISVDAFYFTTLLPTAPKLMLNVESDDYGLIERRDCGCPLETYGFTDHLRHIRSFRKLTGEGVTLVGSEMIHILQEELPARFGGSPLDYQLWEEEDSDGLTRLSLVVSPEVEIADETAVVEAVLEALGQSSVAADLARAVWSQARTLRVKRTKPTWTSRGKLMPLHLVRSSDHAGDTSPHSGSGP
jgi:hypothetical protein